MNVGERIKTNIQSPFVKHLLMVLNLGVFFAVSFLSLSLDTRYPFNYVNMGLVALFVINTIVYLILTRTKPKRSVFLLCGVGLLAWMLISYAVNGFKEFPRTPILMVLLSLSMYLWLTSNRKYLYLYLLAFLLASWGFVILFIASNFSAVIRPNFSTRIGSSFGNENDVARHLVFAFLINGYHLYVFKKKALKVLFAITSLLCAYLLLLTGSISNLILAVICAIILCFVAAGKKQKIGIGIAVGASVGLLVLLIFVLPVLSSIKERILSIINTLFEIGAYRADSSFIGRLRGAQYGFELLFESPLFGNGFNSVVANYKIMSHNNLAEMGADFGLPALLFEEILILYPLFGKKALAKKGVVLIMTIGFYIIAVQFVLVTFNSKIEALMIPLLHAIKSDDKDFVLSWRYRRNYLPIYRARIK